MLRCGLQIYENKNFLVNLENCGRYIKLSIFYTIFSTSHQSQSQKYNTIHDGELFASSTGRIGYKYRIRRMVKGERRKHGQKQSGRHDPGMKYYNDIRRYPYLFNNSKDPN